MSKIYPTAPFTVLVANHSGQVDSKGNRVEIRQGFQQQQVLSEPGQNYHALLTGAPAASTGEVVVADNDFTTGQAILFLGEFKLINGEQYTPGGSTALTATALAAAIDNLDGFSASAAVSTVTITGPLGPTGGNVLFKVLYTGTVANFTLTPTDGTLTVGGPTLAGPQIL